MMHGMSSSPAVHRLVLIRHAKSAYPYGVPDHERPLAGKGRRNAHAAGDWFVSEGPPLDLAICSDAQRARHTWEIIAEQLPSPPPMRLDPGLYHSSTAGVLDAARGCEESVHTLALIGHEPSLSAATLLLAGDGSDPLALAQVAAKFPTNGIALLRVDAPWAELPLGGAVLERFVVPRG